MTLLLWPGIAFLIIVVGAVAYWVFDSQGVGLVVMIVGGIAFTISSIAAAIGTVFERIRIRRERGPIGIKDPNEA